jgi:hypothetical protein
MAKHKKAVKLRVIGSHDILEWKIWIDLDGVSYRHDGPRILDIFNESIYYDR